MSKGVKRCREASPGSKFHTSKCDKHTSCHTSKMRIPRFYRACHTCEGYLPPPGGESFPLSRTPVGTCRRPSLCWLRLLGVKLRDFLFPARSCQNLPFPGATKSRRRWERKGINSNNHQHSATIVVLKMIPCHQKYHFVSDQIPKLKCYLSGTSIVSAHQMIPARKKIWYHLLHLHTTRRPSLLALPDAKKVNACLARLA